MQAFSKDARILNLCTLEACPTEFSDREVTLILELISKKMCSHIVYILRYELLHEFYEDISFHENNLRLYPGFCLSVDHHKSQHRPNKLQVLCRLTYIISEKIWQISGCLIWWATSLEYWNLTIMNSEKNLSTASMSWCSMLQHHTLQ